MAKYYPDGDTADGNNVYGFLEAQTLVQVLKQCGDDLSRENIMRQAADIHDLALPMLLPGVAVNTSPSDFRALKQMRLVRFDGQTWQTFSQLIGDEM
jgi:branched-chain amino acid transport system substrate-binding protein